MNIFRQLGIRYLAKRVNLLFTHVKDLVMHTITTPVDTYFDSNQYNRPKCL